MKCICENGWRAGSFAAPRSVTTLSKGMSWFSRAPFTTSRTRSRSSANVGSPEASMRNASVFVKTPTIRSISARSRPITWVPSVTSLAFETRCRSAVRPVKQVVNIVQLCSRLNSAKESVSGRGRSRETMWPATVFTLGRELSVSSSNGLHPERAERQYCSCSPNNSVRGFSCSQIA